jgi:hypothetical protein
VARLHHQQQQQQQCLVWGSMGECQQQAACRGSTWGWQQRVAQRTRRMNHTTLRTTDKQQLLCLVRPRVGCAHMQLLTGWCLKGVGVYSCWYRLAPCSCGR